MRRRQRLLPCGRVIYYDETTPHDIGTQVTMKKRLLSNKKKLEKLVPFKNAGKNDTRWAGLVYNRFTTFLTEKLVERLLSGDRIGTLDDHRWMISGEEYKGTRYLNWHTNGQVYTIVIKGVEGKYAVRMSRRKRKELKERINGGQNYHTG